MRFAKYHALGNDYIVLDPVDFPEWKAPSPAHIRTLCHRHFGVGSDGILWGPLEAAGADCAVRIFNPDGSEAEKSGNGLRIFSRFLLDRGHVRGPSFRVATAGGTVRVSVGSGAPGAPITVDMGAVTFESARIPVTGPAREVLCEALEVEGRPFVFSGASIGNPHCVIAVDAVSPELARQYGPAIETHRLFPNRTNVQFMQVLDRHSIRLEIWERGAGYTLASGSSSSAAAAVAHRLGLVERTVTVHMPGGPLFIELDEGYHVRMTGPVTRVAEGVVDPGLLQGG